MTSGRTARRKRDREKHLSARRIDAIMEIYEGSNGEKTKELYAKLMQLGPAGHVAMNVFRAQKASSRAKVYRGGPSGGGSWKGQAYDKKAWSIGLLCEILTQHGDALGIRWGWRIDPAQAIHNAILFVELPTGQVSFHTSPRGKGPDYLPEWDGVRKVASTRICRWIADIFEGVKHEKKKKPDSGGVARNGQGDGGDLLQGLQAGRQAADRPDVRSHDAGAE